MKVVIVGAGVIGAISAYRLAQAGVEVMVIEAQQPASRASGASFGWVNASFYLDRNHFNLRMAGFDAHRRLASDLGSRAMSWTGCLSWENDAAVFDAQYQALSELGYDVTLVGREEIERLEPMINPPERALLFRDEGAVDLTRLTADALNAAAALGARLICGVPVTGLIERHGVIAGIAWDEGEIPADRVLLAAGAATERLLATVGVAVPMLYRPALVLRSEPMPPLISHVLIAPGQEIRQQPNGQILAPTVSAHQRDDAQRVEQDLEMVAEPAMRRVSALLGCELRWTELQLAARPMPADGLPVMGPCGPEGLFVSTMHSGATLGPIAAEIAVHDICDRALGNALPAMVAPYRPERFTS